MSYKKIREGCVLYHNAVENKDGPTFDKAYVNYFNTKSEETDEVQIHKLIEFLEDWKCFVYLEAEERRDTKNRLIRTLPPVLRDIMPRLEHLQRRTILTMQDEESYCIEEAYKALSKVRGVGDTIASKILHTINPELIVMWDNNIRVKYGHPRRIHRDRRTHCRPDKCASWYINFLRKMRKSAQKAVDEANSVESLKSCLHDLAFKSLKNENYSPSLAKILDEYNYMKHTKNHPRLAN